MKLYSYIKINCNLTKSEVTKLYNENKILLNNEIVPLSCPVRPKDIVTVEDKIIQPVCFKYFLYYKPKGILSVISIKDNSYIKNIECEVKLSLAGRLDKDSEGLMILTNDGSFINSISNPKSKLEKEYIVVLQHPITDDFIHGIQKSYIIRNRTTTPIIAKKIDNFTISMILFEGVYHQIRTIVKLNKNKVISLKRIRIGNYKLNDMKPNELKEFKKHNELD